MAVDFGIGGTGKTWIAEAPEPIALANSLARQGIAQQGRAQRDSISLNRNRSAAKSLDATGRDAAMKDLSIPQVGLFQPQLNADYKEGLDDIQSRFQPGVNDAQIRDELRNYKLKMEGLSGQYKAYGDEINKSICRPVGLSTRALLTSITFWTCETQRSTLYPTLGFAGISS